MAKSQCGGFIKFPVTALGKWDGPITRQCSMERQSIVWQMDVTTLINAANINGSHSDRKLSGC